MTAKLLPNAAASGAAALSGHRYISVTTFRRDGSGVATPVEFIVVDGSLFFRTLPESGKVKRLKRNPNVTVAACTIRGKVNGPVLQGVASLLTQAQTEALLPAFVSQYGFLLRLLARIRRPRSQGVRIDLPA